MTATVGGTLSRLAFRSHRLPDRHQNCHQSKPNQPDQPVDPSATHGTASRIDPNGHQHYVDYVGYDGTTHPSIDGFSDATRGQYGPTVDCDLRT